MASLQALTISAAGDAAIDGKLLAGGPLSIDAIGKIAAGADAKLQAKGALRLDAGKTLTLAGLAETNAGMTLASGTDLRVDGSAMAWRRAVVDGGPGADAGRDGQSAGQRPAASPGRRQAAGRRHDLGRAGYPPVVQCRHRGERQDGRQWPLEHQGRHRSVGRQERPGARQRQPVPLRRPGPAHRRHGRHRRDGGHGGARCAPRPGATSS